MQITLPRRESEDIELNYQTAYVIVYLTLSALGTANAVWQEMTYVQPINPSYTIDAIIAGIQRAGTAAIPITIALVEIGGRIVVLANRMLKKAQQRSREQGREEGRVEGREEGLAEGLAVGEERANNRWIIWNLRRNLAEANSEPFDEPPPAS